MKFLWDIVTPPLSLLLLRIIHISVGAWTFIRTSSHLPLLLLLLSLPPPKKKVIIEVIEKSKF